MIITRGGTARYKEGVDSSTRINAWLKENPEAKLVDLSSVAGNRGVQERELLLRQGEGCLFVHDVFLLLI